MSLCVSVSAKLYNGNDKLTIELPDDYTEVGEGKFIADDDSSFSITVKEKEDKKYCIEDMSEEELLKEAETEAQLGAAAFAAIGKKGDMEVVSCKKAEHPDDKFACVTVYKTSMEKEGKTVSHLQKTYFFSCANNEYTFVYTPIKDENIDALDASFESIVINEADAESTVDKLMGMIAPAIIILLFLFGIFKFIRGRKR